MKGGVHKGEILDRRIDIGALLGVNEESIKPEEGSFEKANRTIGGRCKNGRWSDTFSLKLAFF